jgi:hypothetical protein
LGISADPSVDLAAVNWGPDPTMFDIQTVSTSQMVTAKTVAEQNIAEGDSVPFSGLFVQYMQLSKVEPIVRTGSIAMMPDELL